MFICQYSPKSFVALHTIIHPRAVTEFVYRYNISGDRAHILLSFKLQSNLRETEVKQLLAELASIDMQGFDISDDELAKSHIRYMIGGCPRVDDERVFRFGPDVILRVTSCLTSFPSFSRKAWRPAQISSGSTPTLEYLSVPLSKSWGRWVPSRDSVPTYMLRNFYRSRQGLGRHTSPQR